MANKENNMPEFNFESSDCKTMQLWEKGRVLKMARGGYPLKEIAELTTKSVDWITTIIGALRNSDVEQELINMWEEHNVEDKLRSSSDVQRRVHGLQKTGKRVVDGGVTKRYHDRRVVPGVKRTRHKASHFGTPSETERIYKPSNIRHSSQSSDGKQRRGHTAGMSGSHVIEKVRNSKDYVGE
jgi:hypothetical protein